MAPNTPTFTLAPPLPAKPATMVAILITQTAEVEVIAQHVQFTHDLQEPVHTVSLANNTKLLWSSANYNNAQVNEYATIAAGQTIKGDAYLLSDLCAAEDLSHMLTMSRSLAPIHKALKPGPQWPTRPWSSCHGTRKRHAVHYHGHHAYHQHHHTREYHVASCEGTPRRLSLDRPASPAPHAPPPHLLSTCAAHLLPTVSEAEINTTEALILQQSELAANTKQEDTQVTRNSQVSSPAMNIATLQQPASALHDSSAQVSQMTCGASSVDALRVELSSDPEISIQSAVSDADLVCSVFIDNGKDGVIPGACDDDVVSTNCGHAPWADLDSNVLSMVALLLPREASTQMSLMQVCSMWRQTLMTDCQILSHAWFKVNPTRALRAANNKPSSSAWGPLSRADAYGRALLPPRSEDSGRHSGGESDDPATVHSGSRSYTCTNLHMHPAASRLQRMHHRHDDDGDEDQDDFGRMALPQSRRGASGPRKQLSGAALLRAVPKFMQHAARAGNASAMASMAQLHEVHGKEDDALRWWKKCAKLGDAEAALRLGMAYYQGTPECPVDSESAQLWLTKGLKWTLGVASLSNVSVDLVAETVTIPLYSGNSTGDAADATNKAGNAAAGSATAGLTAVQREILRRQRREQRAQELAAATPSPVQQMVTLTLPELWAWRSGASVPALVQRALDAANSRTGCDTASSVPATASGSVMMPSSSSSGLLRAASESLTPPPMSRHGVVASIDYSCSQLRPVIGAAAVMLAFLHFDGEGGLKSDKAQACILFKLASLCGSAEAAQVLGWIFSTGQYGQ